MPSIKNLECFCCQATLSAATPQTLCPQCKGSLYVRYVLRLRGIAARDAIVRDAAKSPWPGMWRYRSVLLRCAPRHSRRGLDSDACQPPPSERISERRGCESYWLVQSPWPRARRHHGASLRSPCACRSFGGQCRRRATRPTPQRPGISAYIFMPRDVPFANYVEAITYGANVTLVDGLISDCCRCRRTKQVRRLGV